ncbi:MAG TPA: DUF523 and DUF1722 domain-containing protein [Methylomirabilota bacterium]|nr:DUF523 and DUF1722 domain-containing protein [Methylomirabilota bacterium]
MAAAPPAWRSPSPPITIGISACLLGEEVRYDGGHRKDSYITGVLGRYFSWVSVCPEMEIGLGAPREAVRLVGDPVRPRMVATQSGRDLTDTMAAYARRRVDALAREGLSGYLLKRASPSCGMERVPIYTEAGLASGAGSGLFARALLDALPLLPVEEEGRLIDPRLRDNFITRVFAFRRLTALRGSAPGPSDIVAFHTAHHYLLLAHSPSEHMRLGRLLAAVRSGPRPDLLERYSEGFMRALAVPASTRKHVEVLEHILGLFKSRLGAGEGRELTDRIGDFTLGLVPLIVPITLINHHVSRFRISEAADQVYLHPDPRETMLRNST